MKALGHLPPYIPHSQDTHQLILHLEGLYDVY